MAHRKLLVLASVVVAMFIAADAAVTTIYNPKYKNIKLDWCAKFGGDCGSAAASQYCNLLGYNYAVSHSPPSSAGGATGVTIVPSTMQICKGASCNTFSYITCSYGGTVRIWSPKVNGAPVDACKKWATNCGLPAATYACQLLGYKSASAVGKTIAVSKGYQLIPQFTLVLADGATCDPDRHSCGTFQWIDCVV